MKTIGELLSLSANFLETKNIPQPRRDAEELLSRALSLQRLDLYLQYDRPVEEEELTLFRKWILRKAKGEPVEYILGQTEFYRCKIELGPSTLIPRPETEILVDSIAKKLQKIDVTGHVLWDLCTGSGCIGIALKKHFPSLKVVLSDVSSEALVLAGKNARQNDVEVEIRQGDLLAPFMGEKANYITCNPPYISEKEYLNLAPSVLHFEPKAALVAGQTGFEFYERLARELPTYLDSKGQAFFEIGSTQGAGMKKVFSMYPWLQMTLNQDWAGLDRFFFLEKQ